MKAALRKCVSGVGLLSGLLCLACCGCATRAISHDGGGESAAVVLVARGRSFARIVVPHDASETVRDAAALLSDCVFRSTGAKLEVETEPVSESEVISLHCGHTTYVKGLDLALHTLDADGFVIAFPDTRNIVIAGPAQYGTEFGVYEFLERHVGVRWLFPGELGEFLPMRQALVIPMVEMRQEPAYHSRLLGGPGWWQGFRTHEKNEKSLWARRNRMQTRMRYHHNLFRLFPPENYTKSHPEFFPIVGGKRYLPTGSKEDQSGWQPCFTEPGTTSEAIRNICAYFKAHPDEVSYSLGLNDGRGGPFSGHCECERCLKAVGTTSINFVGRQNRSELYYDWCNRVIAGVLEQHPDKHFGCLAYSEAAEPPKQFKVHPRLAPYLTYDRMKWYDREIESEGQELTGKWAGAASGLGWYDYIYGKQYAVPRTYFHKMAEYLRFGYEHNVRHYYAEAYPSDDWHEGPKLYLALKLLWNPYLDVDATLHDWYINAVGTDAAPYLAQYFEFWENFWSERVPRTAWFRGGAASQWLPFKSTGYLEALDSKDLAKCERLLGEVVRLASGRKQQARAKFFLDSFTEHVKIQVGELTRALGTTKIRTTLMKNSFDAGFEDWGTWQRGTSKAKFSWDRTVGHLRPGSLKVDMHGSYKGPVCFMKNHVVQDAEIFSVSVWCKTDALPPSAVFLFTAKWQSEDGKWHSEKFSRCAIAKDSAAGKWCQLSVVFRVPVIDEKRAHTLICLLNVSNARDGIVWFDDFVLSEAESAKTQ